MEQRFEATPPRAERYQVPPAPPYVVEVVLHTAAKLVPYLCGAHSPPIGTAVVVESERGTSLGWTAMACRAATPDELQTLPSIIRLATQEDLVQEDKNREREDQAFRTCLRLVNEHKLPMKLVRAHLLVGATKIVFYFTADGRVDFRALVRDLAAELRIRIEMRQIGVRDETKMLGGVGHCGRELCCATWLRTFVPVSIRMAKDQNLALNPQKVSGACGRLMCCLAYEHEIYVDFKRGMPKIGKKVNTSSGPGKVTNLELLKQRVVVELETGGRLLVAPDELLPLPEGMVDDSDTGPADADNLDV